MQSEVQFAGFCGQAVMLMGQILAQAAMKLGEALYKQSGGGASTDGEVPNMEKDDADDDIVDADFTEVGDDDKKTS